MGNHQDRSGVVLQIVLKPEQGHEVQVVGRLVQHEQVRFDNEKAGQVSSHDPATTHFLGRTFEAIFLVSETTEHFLGFGFHFRVIEGVKLALGLIVFGNINGSGVLKRLESCFQILEHAGLTGRNLQHRVVTHFLTFLGQEAGQSPLVTLHCSLVRFLIAQDNPENRGFTGPVGTNQRDALSIIDLRVGAFEEDSAAVGFFEVTDGEHTQSDSCISPFRKLKGGGIFKRFKIPKTGK